MLPPPDGSGPHPGENRSFRLRTAPLSLDQHYRGARHRPYHFRRRWTGRRSCSRWPRQPSSRGHPISPCKSRAGLAAPQATPLDLTGTTGSFEGWMRSLPGNIDLQGSQVAARSLSRAASEPRAPTLQITAEGPDIAAFGPYLRLPLPTGGPYALNAKAADRRNSLQGRGPLAEGRRERADRRSPVPGRPQRHADDHRQRRRQPARPGRSSSGARRRGDRPPIRRRRSRQIPTLPFQATWLGRSTISVTVRLVEVVGLAARCRTPR